MKKVSSVTDLDTATGYSKKTNPTEKAEAKDNMQKIMFDFDQKDINEPFAKNMEKMTKSIEEALSGLNSEQKINVFNENTQKFLRQDSPTAKVARNNLGIALPKSSGGSGGGGFGGGSGT
jgi:hypothetical protein